MGLEGVVAKRASAPYRGERCTEWIKVRCVKEERLRVIGYVPEPGKSIAAPRLGQHEGHVDHRDEIRHRSDPARGRHPV
jgi:bifunctional non-homologous end joining protein LigD